MRVVEREGQTGVPTGLEAPWENEGLLEAVAL